MHDVATNDMLNNDKSYYIVKRNSLEICHYKFMSLLKYKAQNFNVCYKWNK